MIHQFAIRPTGGGGGGSASIKISAGTLSADRTDVTFANSNGVSFGLNVAGVVTATVRTNYLTTAMASDRGSDFVQATAAFHGTNASGTIASNAISVSVAAAANNSINISAGTTSSNVTAVTFSNGSGVSFGFDGTNVTATVATNYQSQGAYLTTAMASNRGSDFVQATAAFAGTNASGTINSTGISVSVAAQSVNSVKFSAGTLSSNRTDITFSNANGVTFGLETNGVITATVETDYQSSGAYLTTAMASDRGSDFVQATAAFAGTNASGTINSTGISVSVAAPAAASVNFSAGTTSSNLNSVVFSNSNNVSFGLNSSTITASIATTYAGTGFTTATTAGVAIVGTLNTSGLSMGVPAFLTTAMQSNAATISNIKISAGASSSNVSAVTFSNSNGVSFGYDGTVITATVATNYQSSGAYLTTAALSQDSSKYAGTAFATTTSAGAVIAGTLNTSGLTLGVPAFLTTAMQSNAATISNILVSAGTVTTNGSAFTFSNSNNFSFGLGTGTAAGIITASYTVPTVTNSSWTVSDNATSGTVGRLAFTNLNNVTLSLSSGTGGLHTIVGSIGTTYAGTGFTTATTTGLSIVGTLNTSGLSMGVPKFISNVLWQDSNGGTLGSSIEFRNSNGVTFGINTALVLTASVAPGTAPAGIAVSNSQTLFSTGTVAFSEGGGAITIASSAGGQSFMFSVPQTSSIVGTNGISISTSGSTISVSNIGPKISAGTLSANRSDVTFSDSNGVSWGFNTNGVITATVGTNYLGLNTSVATTAGTDLAMTGNSSGVTIGYAKWITTAAQSSAAMSFFENLPFLDAASTTLSASGSVLQVIPFVVPHNISIGFMRVPVSMSYVSTEVSGTTANSTWTVNRSYTDCAAIFTQLGGASSLSLGYLTSSQATWVFQNQIQAGAQGSRYTVTQNVTYPISGTTSNYTTSYPQSSANVQISSASLTLFTGLHWLDIPMGFSLSEGNYWLALGRSTNSATQAGNAALGGASMGMSFVGVSQNNVSIALMGAATNSSNQLQPGLGSWSTNAAVMSTSSLQLASISAMSSGAKPYFQMIRYA